MVASSQAAPGRLDGCRVGPLRDTEDLVRIALDHACECTDMQPRSRNGTLVLVALLASATAACSLTGVLEPTPEIAEEHMPSFASVDVIGDPEVAPVDTELELWILPEDILLRSTTIPAGTVIRWSEGLSEGRIRLVATGEASCARELDLPPETSTHTVLRHDGSSCSIDVVDAAPPDVGTTLAAEVTVQPWEGLLVEAVSLDTPAQPVPEPTPPDEGGLAQLPWLYPGRYEIRLRRGDAVLETQAIEVLDGGPPGGIRLVLDGIPD